MKKIICFFVLLIFVFTSCSKEQYKRYDFFAMNTFVSVISTDEGLYKSCENTIKDVENKFSRTLAKSEISRINNDEDFTPSRETLKVLEEALEISKNTDYTFSPCLGALTELWNITSGENYVPDDEQIKKALELCDTKEVYVKDNMVVMPTGTKIDLGGVAKGYALQVAADVMKSESNKKNTHPDFCISLGGNVAVSGSSQSMKKQGKVGWNVGITNPFDKNTILGSIVIDGGFVSVSGAYERFFEKDGQIYHHIFDAQTGCPAKTDIASAVVYSKNALEADALSTALFVMGKDKAAEFYKTGLYGFEMLLVTNDGEILVSKGFDEKFYVEKDAKDLKGNLFANNITVID